MDNRGFTLVEIIVSVTIFTVVIMAGIGAILSINSVNRRAQAVKITMDNLNFALEGIVRELRLGRSYDCDNSTISETPPVPEDCTSSAGKDSIAFLDNQDNLVKFRYNTTEKRVEKFDPERFGSAFIPLTSPDVQIDALRFYVYGTDPGDSVQPRIVVTLAGRAGTTTPEIGADFRLQTSVVQRRVDVADIPN